MTLPPFRLTQILEEARRPVGVKELLRLAGLNPGQQTEVKRVLRELVRLGEVHKDGKRFFLPQRGKPETPAAREVPGGTRSRGHAARTPGRGRTRGQVVEGVLHVHRDGFGFVHPLDDEQENLYLPVHEARRALDGDRVRVELLPRDGRTQGRLVEVLSRRREQVVGTYVVRGRQSFVIPRDPTLQEGIRVPRTQLAQDGDLVKVRLGVGAELIEPGEGLFGEVAGSVGRPGDPSGEVLSIAFSEGFSDEFAPEVMDEADAVPLTVSRDEAQGEGRRDLRELPLVTIDGEDARDFDDAVYAERVPNGYRLVVAIADVTQYVQEGHPLDKEALHRATSVYLPNRVLPMLPERLSAGICSLKPEEDRLCMVADMMFDRTGTLRETELYPGVMRSQARCTYNEVQAVLDGESVPHRNAFRPHFERLQELARLLTRKREKRGAIDFDLPEHKVVLDADGKPLRMEKRERQASHRLIEECMLAANEAVARFFQEQEQPSIYRFHAEPDEEKLESFISVAEAHGFHLRRRDDLSSKVLADFVKQLEGHPERRALNQLLLRSMMQAVYSAENVGHYGLAAEQYLHFTSPIRRYPDLIVHRLLKRYWARPHKRSPNELEREIERLEAVAVQSSERERAAMQVEREVVAFYSTLLMKDRLGEEFAATVASVVDFGFFIELDEEHVEGLVKGETLGPGFRLDPALHALVYPATGRRIRVGQQLTARLVSVNLERRQLDFEVVAFEGEQGAAERVPPGERRPPKRERREPRERGRPAREERPRREEARRLLSGRPPPEEPPGEREVEAVAPAAAPAELPDFVPDPGSPHPGFDRLRALAARRKAQGDRPKAQALESGPSRGESRGRSKTERSGGARKPGSRPGPKGKGGGGKRGSPGGKRRR